MPRSRNSEMPSQQRQSPRAPLHLRTTSSTESNGVLRPVRDRSPKLEDHRRSPRSPLPELGVCNQKKRGTRVADLETRLGHAKEELKKLKEQLASAENAKRDAQLKLEETKKLISTVPGHQVGQEEESSGGGEVEEVIDPPLSVPKEEVEAPMQGNPLPETSTDPGVDVIAIEQAKEEITEVLGEKEDENGKQNSIVEDPVEAIILPVADPNGSKETESLEKAEEIFANKEDLDSIIAENAALRRQLDEAKAAAIVAENVALKKQLDEAKLAAIVAENAVLKKQLDEAKAVAAAVKAKDDKLGLKVRSLLEEFEQSKAKSTNLEEQLEIVEAAKAQLEKEIKKLRIQTDQWRKAADAAADIISSDGGMGMDFSASSGGGRRMAERCGSMDKHLGGSMGCEQSGIERLGLPLMTAEFEEGLGNGKRKAAGIRMFGELWKKKGQQK